MGGTSCIIIGFSFATEIGCEDNIHSFVSYCEWFLRESSIDFVVDYCWCYCSYLRWLLRKAHDEGLPISSDEFPGRYNRFVQLNLMFDLIFDKVASSGNFIRYVSAQFRIYCGYLLSGVVLSGLIILLN